MRITSPEKEHWPLAMNNRTRKIFYLCLLVFINFLWAATFTATKIAVSHAGPVTITFWVFLFASVVLYPFYFYEKRKLNHKSVGSNTSSELG